MAADRKRILILEHCNQPNGDAVWFALTNQRVLPYSSQRIRTFKTDEYAVTRLDIAQGTWSQDKYRSERSEFSAAVAAGADLIIVPAGIEFADTGEDPLSLFDKALGESAAPIIVFVDVAYSWWIDTDYPAMDPIGFLNALVEQYLTPSLDAFVQRHPGRRIAGYVTAWRSRGGAVLEMLNRPEVKQLLEDEKKIPELVRAALSGEPLPSSWVWPKKS
jgi:hypothetical protein